MPVNSTHYLFLSLLLFSIGVMGTLMRRNAIIIFMCIELMLNAVNLLLVSFSKLYGDADAQLFVFFIMVVAAAEVGRAELGQRVPDAADEAPQVLAVVLAQQLRIAGQQRRVGVQLGGPVDLVQPDLRVAEEVVARGWIRVEEKA